MSNPDDDQSTPKPTESMLRLRVKRADKAKWVRAAQKANSKLANWVIANLNKSVDQKEES